MFKLRTCTIVKKKTKHYLDNDARHISKMWDRAMFTTLQHPPFFNSSMKICSVFTETSSRSYAALETEMFPML